MMFAKTLNRDEMRNITAGSECSWDGCSTASSTYNCWSAECTNRFQGQEAMDCALEVNQLHENAIGMCGTSYG